MREATDATLERAVPFAIDSLSRIADTELDSTASVYKEGLRDAISTKGRKLTITLTGTTKDIEVGYPARDMKPELLKSSAAKQGPNGKYVDISFRHKMSEMTSDVKSAVKAKVRVERVQARQENRPERSPMRVTGKMPGGTNTQNRFNSRGQTKRVEVQHKTSVFSDMIRTKVGAKGQYNTIRRISSNSDPQSWWHPGFKGLKALKRVAPDLRRMMKQVYKQELKRRSK